MGIFEHIRALGRRAVPAFLGAAFVAVLAIMAGCNEPVTVYQVPGTCVAAGQKVLVLPFMDTRTFTDDSDPHRYDLGYHVRGIFIDSMRNHADGNVILAPNLPLPKKSLTNAELAEIGRRCQADVVVSGQVFSFTDTRAASIPPRAGMFVRVVSSSDGSLLFAGDHYQAATLPGAGGGRDLQARNVSDRLVQGFLQKAGPALSHFGKVASGSALAMLSPVTITMPFANSAGRDKASGANPLPEPPPFPDASDLATIFDPSTWDNQEAPALPTIPDFDNDFFSLPASGPAKTSDAAKTPTPAPTQSGESTPAPATSTSADAATATDNDPANPDLSFFADLADGIDPAAADATDTATNRAGGNDSGAETAAPARDFASLDSTPRVSAALVADTGAAAIDELPMIDFSEVNPRPDPWGSFTSEYNSAAKLSGDDLARDLLETDGGLNESATFGLAAAAPAATGDAGDTATTIVLEPETDALADAGNEPADEIVPETTLLPLAVGVLENDDVIVHPFDLDPDTLEVLADRTPETVVPELPDPNAPRTAAANAIPASAPRGRLDAPAARDADPDLALLNNDDVDDADAEVQGDTVARQDAPGGSTVVSELDIDPNGPVTSTPLAFEQPSTIKTVDNELAEDPNLSEQEPEALVSVVGNARPDAIRVLILPYHDRPNPNNLIDNTGGGEVVTTLYATQMAMDPGIRMLWDATGQATHDRLVSREEALAMGRLAGADYVMRGQVVEFRRAQSVPSLFSAVISTAVLAAQVFFAEMSGVDVATEVYRVKDGMCVMSRRDRAQQKYVVQAEKTVRRIADNLAASTIPVLFEADPEEMDPLIDELTPVSLLSNR
ncbi:MAG: hypothetical protein LIQ30_07035 [Planctomycetes bacterium]|nr:hypothetical protein [Planctomycetota bacterium]